MNLNRELSTWGLENMNTRIHESSDFSLQALPARPASRRWPTRFPRLPHPLPVDANQRPDEQQELADEDEHCLVDDPLRRYPERRDADDCRYDSEPDGDDFF